MRVVMFVYNDMTMDVRVAREAATLAAAGHEVTVIARPRDVRARVGEAAAGDGFDILRVPVPHAWRRPWSIATLPGRAAGALVRRLRPEPPRRRDRRTVDYLVKWRFAVMGWNARAATAAPTADVYHGHDLTGLAAAASAAGRTGARLVYDSHELFVESGANAIQPGWVKARLRRQEGALARGAAALVTVNESIARVLGERLGIARRVVVYNAPAPWTSPAADPRAGSPLRAALGGTTDQIVLYHGGFQENRGLRTLARAFLEPPLDGMRLALLGSGPLAAEMRALAATGPLAGRMHVLDAVPPSELLAWVAGADVSAMVNLPASENERLSTPNKLFESLAAGVPVVSSDFPERRRIVIDNASGPLGAVCDPSSPAAIAAAIASLLDAPLADREALRVRCATAARDAWNWDREGAKLVRLYADLEAEGRS